MHIPCLIITCCAFLAQIIYTTVNAIAVYKNVATLSDRIHDKEEKEKIKFLRKECFFPFFKFLLVNIGFLAVGIILSLIDGVGNTDLDFINQFLHIAIIFWFVWCLISFAYLGFYHIRYRKMVQYREEEFDLVTHLRRSRSYAGIMVIVLMTIATTMAINLGLILSSILLLG